MLKNIGFILYFIFVPFAIIKGQNLNDSVNSDYNDSIEKYRIGKNIKLLYSDPTPLTSEELKNFKGLNYFQPDIHYRVQATLIKDEQPETVFMKTSTERLPEYIKYGSVLFKIDTLNLKLFVYQNKKLGKVVKQDKTLFIPFRDATSGNETYGGGRYVDCEIPDTGSTVTIDFNKAYNPYCAYNHKYSCVIPPDENRLPLRIEAGEKSFEE